MARDNPVPSAMGHFSAFASFPDFFLTTWSKASNAHQPNNVSRSLVQKGLDNSTRGGWQTGQSPLGESMTCLPTPEHLKTGGASELIQQHFSKASSLELHILFNTRRETYNRRRTSLGKTSWVSPYPLQKLPLLLHTQLHTYS